MFNKFFGNKKKELINKKINNQDGYKLTITEWIDGVLRKKEEFFNEFDDAKKEGEKREGLIKIYDRDNKLLHTQKNKDYHGKGHDISKGKHKGHDHDDDTYA
jgi:hypothetical protein